MEAFRIWLQEEPALFLGAAAALMLMSGSLYERQREHKTTQTLMLKGGTTLIAALVAGAAVWQQNSLGACFVLAATLCCAVADVLLEQIFNFGACVFALGHICYLAAYFSEAHFSIATAVSFVILLAGMYLIHRKQTVGKSGREILAVVAYGLVLSAMTAGAITYCVQQRDFGSMLTAFGAVGFFISDNILIWRLLSGYESRLQGAVLLLFARVGHGQGGQQLLGVRVLRVLHNLVGIAVLHDLALMHHHDAVGKHIDHRQIMGDEQAREADFRLQSLPTPWPAPTRPMQKSAHRRSAATASTPNHAPKTPSGAGRRTAHAGNGSCRRAAAGPSPADRPHSSWHRPRNRTCGARAAARPHSPRWSSAG